MRDRQVVSLWKQYIFKTVYGSLMEKGQANPNTDLTGTKTSSHRGTMSEDWPDLGPPTYPSGDGQSCLTTSGLQPGLPQRFPCTRLSRGPALPMVPDPNHSTSPVPNLNHSHSWVPESILSLSDGCSPLSSPRPSLPPDLASALDHHRGSTTSLDLATSPQAGAGAGAGAGAAVGMPGLGVAGFEHAGAGSCGEPGGEAP